MKYLGLLIAILIQVTCLGQSKNDLIGTWQIVKIIDNSSSSLPGCNEAAKEYKLTFNSDNTYSFDAGPGYVTSGKWKIEGTKINFFDSKLSDPSQGTVADHAYPFEINNKGILIVDEYVCSELGGKTHYKKI